MTVVKDFPYFLRVPSTDCFTSIAPHKEKHTSQELAFLCGLLFSVMRHNSFVLFHLKLNIFWTMRAHQSANFQTCNCSNEN